MKKILLIFVVLLFAGTGRAQFDQGDTIRFNYNGNELVSGWNGDTYESTIFLRKNGQSVVIWNDENRIESISAENLKGNGEKSLIINTYTGGAHCCFIMYIGEIDNNKLVLTDTISWGDSYYEAKDLDNNGKIELVGSYVGMAYEFTSFAGSQFPILIYGYKNGRMQEVNADFKKFVYDDIEEFKKELMSAYANYSCPEKEDEYWGSDAGEVRSFLAAIVFDYVSINEAEKGYEYVDEYYRCSNKEQFKEFLRNSYK